MQPMTPANFSQFGKMNVKYSVRKNPLRRQRVVIARSDQKIERAEEASLGAAKSVGCTGEELERDRAPLSRRGPLRSGERVMLGAFERGS